MEYFLAVAEEENFTLAARRVHISQSGISAQVRQLERELGQQLFIRRGRTTKLTQAGKAIVPHVRAALSAAEEISREIDQLNGLLRGQLKIGMVSGCALGSFAAMIAAFHDRFPGIQISLSEDVSEKLVSGIDAGELDLALIGASGEQSLECEAITIADERLVAAASRSGPFSLDHPLRLADLADLPLICLPRRTGVRSALDSACASLGIEPRVGLEASALVMVAELARNGLGVAVVPESTVGIAGEQLQTSLISEPEIRSRLELVWKRGGETSPAAKMLTQHARKFWSQKK